MSDITFRLVRTGNPRTIRFEVLEGGEVKVAGDADASTIGGFIENLWHARAELEPPLPMEFKPGQQYLRLENPPWNANWRPGDGALNLTLRHPGLGWLAFAFAGDALDHLVRFIQTRPEPGASGAAAAPQRH